MLSSWIFLHRYFLTMLIMVTEQLYWKKSICGCFRFILLWLLKAIMKRCVERCALQLYCNSLRRKELGNGSCMHFVSEEEYPQLMLTDRRLISKMICADMPLVKYDPARILARVTLHKTQLGHLRGRCKSSPVGCGLKSFKWRLFKALKYVF